MKSERLSFPESFKYLHLGNPESILICPIELRYEDFLHGKDVPESGPC